MNKNKVTLSSGREFEIKALTLEQRADVDDLLSEYYFKLGIDFSDYDLLKRTPFSYKIGLKACKYSIGELPDDLSNIEIIELFTEIQKFSHLSDVEKKS